MRASVVRRVCSPPHDTLAPRIRVSNCAGTYSDPSAPLESICEISGDAEERARVAGGGVMDTEWLYDTTSSRTVVVADADVMMARNDVNSP